MILNQSGRETGSLITSSQTVSGDSPKVTFRDVVGE